MNPEFRRNLILELSIHRLVALPVILIVAFVATNAVAGKEAVTLIATFALYLLLVLWGGRLAAEAVLGEVAARTWDAQRLSAIGPWAMSWGKLVGTTVFAWYGALWSAPAYFWSGERNALDLLEITALGLFTQTIALFLSLLLLRAKPQGLRFQVTLVHLLALLAVVAFHGTLDRLAELPGWEAGRWYAFPMAPATFRVASELTFLAWAVVGLHRMMRCELQFRPGLAVRLAFIVFLAFYAGGLPGLATAYGAAGWFTAFLASGAAAYVAVFVEPKDFVHLTRLRYHWRQRDYKRVLGAVPTWIFAYLVAALCGGVAIAVWSLRPEEVGDMGPAFRLYLEMPRTGLPPFVVAALFFLLRDIGLIHFFTLDARVRRGHLTSLVYLAVLYALVPLILSALELEELIPIAVPSPFGHPLVVTLPALAQAAAALALCVWRWRTLERGGLGLAAAR